MDLKLIGSFDMWEDLGLWRNRGLAIGVVFGSDASCKEGSIGKTTLFERVDDLFEELVVKVVGTPAGDLLAEDVFAELHLGRRGAVE